MSTPLVHMLIRNRKANNVAREKSSKKNYSRERYGKKEEYENTKKI
jgi:hypothetical protein